MINNKIITGKVHPTFLPAFFLLIVSKVH